MSTLERAIAIAVEAHAGQADRYGRPYITHPLRLMMQMQNDQERTVAVLHDVVEDNATWSLARLRAEGFDEEIVAAVDHLSRREPEESYEDYVQRAGSLPLAKRVKLADLRDNMDLTRIDVLDERALARLQRYHAAWRALNGEK